MATSNLIPLICHGCGATGSVSRVTANLQCRCGSTDLDLNELPTHEAADWGLGPGPYLNGDEEKEPYDDGELHLPHYVQHGYDTNYNRGRSGKEELKGFPPGEHANAASLGFQHGLRDRGYDQRRNAAASGPGTGWGQSRPDPLANWNEYVGPAAGRNPEIDKKTDADDTTVCHVCNGTGHDPRASGGGYEENVCRNCHGTGEVTYPTGKPQNESLDAHKKGPVPLGGGYQGSKRKAKKVVIPTKDGGKRVAAAKGNKLVAMANAIIEKNSGLSSYEAFELARRAVEGFME